MQLREKYIYNESLFILLGLPTLADSSYIEDITRRREDMTLPSSGENNILRTSAASESNLVFNTRR
jgi:hypothetical protein